MPSVCVRHFLRHAYEATFPTRDEALLTLYLTSSGSDTASFAAMVDDFISQYPTAVDGYVYRASLAVDGGRYADADRDMQHAVEKGDQKAEAHYNYSRIIYQKELYHQQQQSCTIQS